MSTTLTQSATAAFPDRPSSGGAGLLIVMASGTDGQYLKHDLGAAQTVLHTRWMMAPATVSGGTVLLQAGFDGSGVETFRVQYDPTAKTVTVDLATSDQLIATLPSALPWHCLELMIDTVTGNAELWLNGVSTDTASGTFTALTTQSLWIGGILKDYATSGQLYLDEWIIADSYIGPVVIEPSGSYADDPARWLVVYNTADNDAVTWAESYRQARNIPFANLVGLNLPTTETISTTQYSSFVTNTNDYLDDNELRNQVMGLLMGYRVPGYVDTDGQGRLEAVPALMHRDATTTGPSSNLNASDTLPTRPTASTLAGDRLTARIDGPDLASAIDLITRATTLINTGLGDGSAATIWLDPFAGSGSAVEPFTDAMVNWSSSLDRMRTRLPLQLSSTPGSYPDVDFSQINQDGIFWGWATQAPPTGFFATPAGKRVISIQLYYSGPAATTIRSGSPSNWIDTPIDAGYAGAVATTRSYSLSAAPYARPFFEALRQGWNLAEAWYLALPLLREGLYLVGDPLLTAATPQAGWDVFGPVGQLESIDPNTPVAALRQDETLLSLSSTQQPASNEQGFYVVRQIDEQGRTETSLEIAQAVNISGVAVNPPMPPSWPDHVAWPLRITVAQAIVFVLWDRALWSTDVTAVELRAEIDGGAEATVATPVLDMQTDFIEVHQALPAVSVRYRWRLTSSGGATYLTPWSTTIGPNSVTNPSLTVIEVQP